MKPVKPGRRLGAVVAALALAATVSACSDAKPAVVQVSEPAAGDPDSDTATATVLVDRASGLGFQRVENPGRTLVRNGTGTLLATFTDGARTVVLKGPERTFEEPSASEATVTTRDWVRLAPRAWSQGAEREPWFREWFDSVLDSTKPDVFETAFEYVEGAPDRRDDEGVRYRGDASFGPFGASGKGRLEANDFYDYLGVSWRFPDVGRQRAEQRRYGSLDCSGFMRIVLGYRLGYPLRGSNEPGPGLPRRAYAIEAYGPGARIVPDRQVTATAYDRLQAGDLVFFQTEGDAQIDHVGMYLGLDSTGHHRFISSRETADGPTMGDIGGTSLLDDGRFYSRGWRAARRV